MLITVNTSICHYKIIAENAIYAYLQKIRTRKISVGERSA